MKQLLYITLLLVSFSANAQSRLLTNGKDSVYIGTRIDSLKANKQNALTLTTTGNSGASTLSGNVLNIPQYTGGTGGGSSITITQSSLIRSWQIGGLLPSVPLPYIVNISGASAYNAFPDALIDRKGRLQVYYSSGNSHASFDHVAKRAVSSNGGATWTTTTITTPLVNCQEIHTAVLSNGTIGMVIASSDVSGHYKVYFATSSDGGDTWGSFTAISDTYPTTLWGSFSTELFEDNGTLYVMYYTAPSSLTQESTFLIKSTDMGVTWGSPTAVATGDGSHDYNEAKMAKWQGSLVLYIRDDHAGKLWRTTSTDGFITHTTLTNVTPDDWVACRPDIVFVGDMVHLLYRGNNQVMNRVTSYDGGISWSGKETVETAVANGYVYSRSLYDNGLIIGVYAMDRDVANHADVRLLTWRYGTAVGLDGLVAGDNINANSLNFSNIPTSNPGAGKIWNNTGVVTIGSTGAGVGISSDTVTYDNDAATYLTATAIRDTAVKHAVNTLVKAEKAAGIWTKLTCQYLMVGAGATANSYNLINTTQYQLAFSGVVTHNTKSITWGGGYAHTGFIPNTGYDNDCFMSFYRSAGTLGTDMGEFDSNLPSFYLYDEGGVFGGRWGWTLAGGSESSISGQGNTGIFAANRSGTAATATKNNTQVISVTRTTTTGYNTHELLLGSLYDNGIVDSPSNSTGNVYTIGHGLTSGEQTSYYNAVQAFVTALGL